MSQQVWGLFTTNCQLGLTGVPVIGNGSWSTAPVPTVPANVQNYGAFYAVGNGPSLSGQAEYAGPDGTTFQIGFDDIGSTNWCSIDVVSGNGQAYTYSCTCTSGEVCTLTVVIDYNG